LKACGYLVSIVSVLLLLIPSLKNAKEDPLLLSCVIAGALASILGMVFRWIAYRRATKKIAEAKETSRAAFDTAQMAAH
jgi:hypothetical protein